jgi:heptosyltransferase-2
MQRILVVGPSWIGDTVLAQPFLKLLQERHSSPALDVLAPSWTLPLLERMPEVRRAIKNPVGHGELRLGEQRRIARELAREHYEQAFVLPNSLKSALIPFLAGIRVRTGYVGELRWGLLNDPRRVDGQRLPQIAQRYAALALARGEALGACLPPLGLRVEEAQRRATVTRLGLDTQRPVAALCPGAEYGPAKRWPVRHFAALARQLSARGYSVWLIGSPGDAAIGAEIERLSPGASRDLCGRTTLGEAIDVLASAQLVVSNDSGLMHVAAALGKPIVALYGSSSPVFTPPLSPEARVLKLDLPCSPCFKRDCPLGHFKCMVDLAPEQVLAAIHSASAVPSMPGKP